MHRFSLLLISAIALLAVPSAQAGTNSYNALPASPVADANTDVGDRFIVKLRDPTADPRRVLDAIGGVFGERLDRVRQMSGGAHVVRLGRRVGRSEAHEVARRLREDARVEMIEPDAVMHPMIVPNDTMYAQQWHYHEPHGGINLPLAWDRSTGSSSITVAVVDSGVVAHTDLAARLVAGYDFIARVPGGSDPGDHGCNGSTSSWHGTHVAGTIGAVSNNAGGVTGVNWASKILPVRVLGKCGGYTSDIVDGMRWAAGIAVAGVPANPSPARVANLSLGGDGVCSATFQSAINDVVARGTVVVVAAGNANGDAANTQPANCSGVITVAATTRSGARASYSNFGSKVTLAAPGGGAGGGVLSTLNTGTTTPGTDSYAYYHGTSMATPHVAGVASLLLSIDPSLNPAQVAQRLQQSARAFPTGTAADCNVAICGAGIVDAAASLAALAPVPPPTSTPGWTKLVDEGQNFSLAGTQTVRYGSAPYWITKSVSNGGSCTSAFFGTDPIVGTVKQCDVSTASAPPPPLPPPPTAGWTQIATEGQSFSVSGTQTVRYGAGSSFVTRSVTNGGACTSAYFGSDPLFGVVKRCEVSTTAPQPPAAWTLVVLEGQSFSVSGTQTVRYGSGSAWISRSVTGVGQCTNTYFGNDPLFGVAKRCEVAS